MCKRLFKALKIKMDNFKLRYELAGADEEIARIEQENEKFKNNWQELKKYVEKLYNESEVSSEDLFFIREKMQELEKGDNNE